MALATRDTITDAVPVEHLAPALALVNPQQLIALAIERGTPIETLERLFALRDKLKAEAAEESFLKALAGFQSQCPIIVKAKRVEVRPREGSPYTFHYAPLDDIVRQVQPILHTHGLSYTINTEETEKAVTAHVTVYHVDGHKKSFRFSVPIETSTRMSGQHKIASAHTYAKRYALCGALGIVTGDDDDDGGLGNESRDRGQDRASDRGPIQQPARAPKPSQNPTSEAQNQPTHTTASHGGASQAPLPPNAVPHGEEWQTTENQEWVQGYISDVRVGTTGVGNKGPWTLWGIVANGVKYGTFSKSVADAAAEAVQSARLCWFCVETKNDKLRIVEIRFVD